jgi:uncharacterized GH25 family protein
MKGTAGQMAITVGAVLVTMSVGACNRPAEQQAMPAGSPAATAPAPTGPVEITLKTDPEPAKMGENTFEAMVMQDGKPVDDANVSVEIFMAAMPAMKMPEMKTTAELKPAGNGMYRGIGQVMMAGNWDVTVMAMRNGQEIGSRKVTVTAK